MSSGITWTGATAAVLAFTGVATGWYWLIAIAVVGAVLGIILIRISRRRAIVRDADAVGTDEEPVPFSDED